MAKSVLEAHPDSDISVTIVWEPMLPSDNEAAARQSSAIFDDPRVRQFWDPNRLSGTAYTRDLFPTMIRDMVASLSADDPLKERLRDRMDLPAEKSPLWDVAFFYDKGVQWKDRAPTPKHWVKQIVFYGESEKGISGSFYEKSFASPPADGDWFHKLADGMQNLMGKGPAKPETTVMKVASLEKSPAPLRAWFNANKDRPRFITLLSPT